jgi:predicted ArsR family transcriptional regulator
MENENTNTVTTPATVAVVETPDTITGTTQEIAAKLGMDYLETKGALVLLAKQGAVKVMGKRIVQGRKGKPATIFQVNKIVTLDLGKKSE